MTKKIQLTAALLVSAGMLGFTGCMHHRHHHDHYPPPPPPHHQGPPPPYHQGPPPGPPPQ